MCDRGTAASMGELDAVDSALAVDRGCAGKSPQSMLCRFRGGGRPLECTREVTLSELDLGGKLLPKDAGSVISVLDGRGGRLVLQECNVSVSALPRRVPQGGLTTDGGSIVKRCAIDGRS